MKKSVCSLVALVFLMGSLFIACSTHQPSPDGTVDDLQKINPTATAEKAQKVADFILNLKHKPTGANWTSFKRDTIQSPVPGSVPFQWREARLSTFRNAYTIYVTKQEITIFVDVAKTGSASKNGHYLVDSGIDGAINSASELGRSDRSSFFDDITVNGRRVDNESSREGYQKKYDEVIAELYREFYLA